MKLERCQAPGLGEGPGMFLSACRVRGGWIVRQLLMRVSPRLLHTSNGLPAVGFAGGASGVLAFPPGTCPASQTRAKTRRVLPQPDPPLPDVFVPLQGCGVRMSLMSSSWSQKQEGKSHQPARSGGREAAGSASGKGGLSLNYWFRPHPH